MSTREFENHFPAFDGKELLNPDQSTINTEFAQKLYQPIRSLLDKLEEGIGKGIDWNDTSVYTGTTGLALLYVHLYYALDEKKNDRYLTQALVFIEPALTKLRRRRISFLNGDAGPLSVAALIYHLLRKEQQKQTCLKKLLDLKTIAYEDDCLPDELLYGRVGYLYALLFVNKHIAPDTVEKRVVYRVYETVLKSGREFSRDERSRFPLLYEWHDKKYLGAAHGMSGILYMLMQIRESIYQKYSHEWVEPCIEMLMSLRFSSGNYPSSIGSASGDKLVHWCHGAPGWVSMFVRAHKVYGEPKYIEQAAACAEVIWQRGLLRKGYGLCHGVAGNGYAFLTMFRATNDQKYLHRACKFAEWCFDYGEHGCRTPDRPFSLFEGLAGTIYFLSDLLRPKASRFPAYELDL